jgi:hypothetical protein
MKFIYSYTDTDLKWDLFIDYSHEKICCKPYLWMQCIYINFDSKYFLFIDEYYN